VSSTGFNNVYRPAPIPNLVSRYREKIFRQLATQFSGTRESFLDRVLEEFARHYSTWLEELENENGDVEGRDQLIALLHWNMVYP